VAALSLDVSRLNASWGFWVDDQLRSFCGLGNKMMSSPQQGGCRNPRNLFTFRGSVDAEAVRRKCLSYQARGQEHRIWRRRSPTKRPWSRVAVETVRLFFDVAGKSECCVLFGVRIPMTRVPFGAYHRCERPVRRSDYRNRVRRVREGVRFQDDLKQPACR